MQSSIDHYFSNQEEDARNYRHVVIRFQESEGGRILRGALYEKAKERIIDIARGAGKGSNYCLIVLHEFPEKEDAEKKPFKRVNHIHFLYKFYKCCWQKKAIKEFVSKFGLRLYEWKVKTVSGLSKYLLQGDGRKILFQAGSYGSAGFHSQSDLVWARREATRCEGDLDDQTDEEDGDSDSTIGTSYDGSSVTRQSKKIQKAKHSEAVQDVDEIKDLLLKYFVKDETQLIRKMTQNEKMAYNMTKLMTKEWTKVFDQARQLAITSVMDRYWEDTMQILPDDPKAYSPPVMSVNKSIKVFTEIMKQQGYTTPELREEFIRHVYMVMNNNIYRKKRNTLYLFGEVSAGKTLIATSLERSKIYSFNTGEYNARSSDFHFEDMALAAIAIINEPQIEEGKVDKFKIILEGGAFDTNVKFKSKSRVEGVPVIVTTNKEIYRYALDAESAFNERWYRHDFKHMISGVDISGGLHPKIWLRLITHMGLHKELADESSESEVELDEVVKGRPKKTPEIYFETAADQEMKPETPTRPGENDVDGLISIEGHDLQQEFDTALENLHHCIHQAAEAGYCINYDFETSRDEYKFIGWKHDLDEWGALYYELGHAPDPERFNAEHCHNYFATQFSILGNGLFKIWYCLNDWIYDTVEGDDRADASSDGGAGRRMRTGLEQLARRQPALNRDIASDIWYGSGGTIGRAIRRDFRGSVARWCRQVALYVDEQWEHFDPRAKHICSTRREQRQATILTLRSIQRKLVKMDRIEGWKLAPKLENVEPDESTSQPRKRRASDMQDEDEPSTSRIQGDDTCPQSKREKCIPAECGTMQTVADVPDNTQQDERDNTREQPRGSPGRWIDMDKQ